jgi:RNA polymerase sigma-70 factor, ECF subfamily
LLNPEHPTSWRIDPDAARRLFDKAGAARWGLPLERFASHLEACVRHAFPGTVPDAPRALRHLETLHLDEVALACACAEGVDAAWDHFVREYRPVLYRAADAIDPSGAARELADSLYAELYGLRETDGERRSHFRYFHGRSTLATWLRAVLSQRRIDRVRRDARVVPLPDDEAAAASPPSLADVGSKWLVYVELMRRLVTAAVVALPARDRLRLRCYYAQQLTLAQIGTLLREHEATVSRQLTRTRRSVRLHVETALRQDEGMKEGEIEECFAAVLHDSGPLDLAELLGAPDAAGREAGKEIEHDRSSKGSRPS